MKNMAIVLMSLGSLSAFAGGGIDDSQRCREMERKQIVSKVGNVLDRAGRSVEYQFVMRAGRAER